MPRSQSGSWSARQPSSAGWRSGERDGHVQPKPKAGGTPSPVRGATVDALIAALGDPTASELTAAYNRQRRGRTRVHVSSMKRALHRHDYVVKKNGAGRRKWIGPTSRPDDKRS